MYIYLCVFVCKDKWKFIDLPVWVAIPIRLKVQNSLRGYYNYTQFIICIYDFRGTHVPIDKRTDRKVDSFKKSTEIKSNKWSEKICIVKTWIIFIHVFYYQTIWSRKTVFEKMYKGKKKQKKSKYFLFRILFVFGAFFLFFIFISSVIPILHSFFLIIKMPPW